MNEWSFFFIITLQEQKTGGRLDAVHSAVCAEAYECWLQGWCYASIRMRHHAIAVGNSGKCTEVCSTSNYSAEGMLFRVQRDERVIQRYTLKEFRGEFQEC
jgi:hypothetical protein